MLLCPKCGKVKEYGIKEYVHRVGIFNENNECVETTEDVGFRCGQPRCLKCNSIIKFYVEPQESEENGKPLIYLEKVYCPLNECMYSDYTEKPYQFDNMTGSMNL